MEQISNSIILKQLNGNLQIELNPVQLLNRPLVIGRRAEICDVTLPLESVSRRHAAFSYRESDNTITVRDEGSFNGTLVNGEQISTAVPLLPGDLITLGEAQFVFSVPGNPPPLKTADEQAEDKFPGIAKLQIIETPVHSLRQGGICRLTPLHVFTLGRASTSDLILQEEGENGLKVSRQQAEIRWDMSKKTYKLVVKGTASATLLNGFTVNGEVLLKEGDIVNINGTQMYFRAPRLTFSAENKAILPAIMPPSKPTEWVLRYTGSAALHEGAEALRLPSAKTIVIGRTREADLQLRDPSVSRKHARLEARNHKFWLIDLGSTNPVRLNDQTLSAPIALNEGDVITIGNFQFTFAKSSEAATSLAKPVLLTLALDIDEAKVTKSANQTTLISQLRPPTLTSFNLFAPSEIIALAELEKLGSFEEVCRFYGSAVTLGGNQPFLLNEPGQFWYIESGQVEIFAVQIKNGQISSSRYHVGTVTSQQAFFSTDAERYGQTLSLFAVPLPNTRLISLTVGQIQQISRQPKYQDLIGDLVETWLAKLYSDITGESELETVKIEVKLDSGTATLEKGQIAATRANLTWLKSDQPFLLSGEEEIAAPLFPLSDMTWLKVLENCTVETFTTIEALASAKGWAGLEAFYQVYHQFKFNRIQTLLYEQLKRTKLRTDYDTELRQSALSYLAAVAENRPVIVPTIDKGTADALFTACRLVGEAQGINLKMPPTREITDQTRKRRSYLDEIMQASRIRSRQVTLEQNWWRSDSGALLGFTLENVPVALVPSSKRSYDLIEPGAGRKVRITKEISDTLQPEAYVFYRSFGEKTLRLRDLIIFGLRSCKGDLVSIGGFGLMISLLALATPILTGLIFDAVIPAQQIGLLWQIFVALAIVAMVETIFTFARSVAILRLETKMENALQTALWDRLLKLPVPFFRQYSVGDLAERVSGVEAIRRTLTGSVLSSLLSAIFSVTGLILLFSYNAGLAAVAVGLALVNLGVLVGFSLWQLKREKELAETQGRMSSLVLQLLKGIAKLRVAGAEMRGLALWAIGFGKQRALTLQLRRTINWLVIFNSVWTIFATMVLFAVVGFSVQSNFSTGSFLAFLVAFGQFQIALTGLSEVLNELLKIMPLYERFRPIIEAKPEESETKTDPGELKGGIEINQVTFRYSPEIPPVLNNISLRIKPGQFVAIVGASGSGKSTLLRLLLGFEKPEAGSVYFDNQDLANLDVQAVRRQTGTVLQNGKLIPGSIFENIVGSAPFTLQEAWAAARSAGFAKDIENMPMGIHTVIPEGGSTLSGGQRQRLMIARALVGQPRIIFFDEATSALDNQTQAIVSRSLEQMQVTRVVIAHRLSTIEKADYIYVLENGKVRESGTYTELIHNKDLFFDLVSRQFTG
jgi:NHLM bacteriocin system ABC transporter ATP-binding protein